MNPDPFDFSAELAPLRIFIRDEVRELLRQHQEAARAAVARWLDETEAQLSRWHLWHARQGEYMRELVLAQAERGEATDPGPCPGEGFIYMRYWRGAVCLHRVDAWVPREISDDAQPVTDRTMPLPVPDDHDVLPNARWAALVAVHDLCREPEERIGPVGRLPYEWLIRVAAAQPADLIPTLRAWMTGVTTPDPNHRPDRPAPPPEPATPPPPGPADSVNLIRRTDVAWVVRFGEEHQVFPLSGWSVLEHVAAAIARPGEAVQICATSEAKDDAADGRSLAEVNHTRNALLEEIAENSRTREANQHDLAMQKECDEKFEQLQTRLQQFDSYLHAATRPGGRHKKLGSDGGDHAWDSFRNLLKALPLRLREQAKMPKLAEYLEGALLPAKPYLTFNPSPGTAPWSVEV